MSEDKKSLIALVPDSVDNAVKNITDKPTQNMGTTLADIWYLVFGSISQAAEKRKLKYSYALQEFQNELKEKISKIPQDKLIEPDTQIIAKALEEAKYCIEKEDLRKMFSNLISNSLHDDTNKYVHPLFINIISQLSSEEAKMIKEICETGEHVSIKMEVHPKHYDTRQLLTSISILEHTGLITSNIHEKIMTDTLNKESIIISSFKGDGGKAENKANAEKANRINVDLTELGKLFCKACISG